MGALFSSPAFWSAAGSIVGGILGKKGQDSANETNMEIAQKQMDFQERMSNTSYQRGVKDLEAAGLNPMLAYSQGGASSPAGSMTRVENSMASGVSSAAQAGNSIAAAMQAQQSRAQTEYIDAQAEKVRSETMDNALNTALLANKIKESGGTAEQAVVAGEVARGTKAYSAKKVMADADVRELEAREKEQTFAADVARRKAESALTEMDIPKSKAEMQFYEGLGKANPYLNMLLQMTRGVSSAASVVRH